MKIVILDIETSGLPPKGATYENDYMVFPYILSMAWKCIKDGQESETYHYIVNQEGRCIPPEASKINGLTDAICNESKFNIFTTLIQFMMDIDQADFVVGYNLYFDTSIIKANILRIIKTGGKTPMEMFDKMTDLLHKDKRIDVMRSCHKLMGGKWPKLEEAYTRLFNESFNAHSAKEDVDATYRIFQELLSRKAIMLLLPEKVIQEVVERVICEEDI